MKLIAQFEPALVTLSDSINKMDEIIQVVDSQQINNNLNNIESITNNLKAITRKIHQGEGVAGSVVFNKDMQQDVITSTKNLTEITSKTITIIGQTQKLLDSLQLQVDEMPEITKKVKPLLEQADKTLKATQQIWPISSGIPREHKQTLTTPEARE